MARTCATAMLLRGILHDFTEFGVSGDMKRARQTESLTGSTPMDI